MSVFDFDSLDSIIDMNKKIVYFYELRCTFIPSITLISVLDYTVTILYIYNHINKNSNFQICLMQCSGSQIIHSIRKQISKYALKYSKREQVL